MNKFMFSLTHILGSFLAPFTNFLEYEALYNAYRKNPAMNAFCSHGNRYMLWLPYRGWENNKDNVTYFGNEELLMMKEAWRKRVPITSERPWCVIARFGKLSFDIHLSNIT